MTGQSPGSYSFRYELTYDELYEAFYLLAFRWSKKFKMAVGLGLIIVTTAMLILFCLDPRKVHLFYIAILAILLLFYLIYMPMLRAKRGAAQLAKKPANFQVRLTENGKVIVQDGSFDLVGDKNARALETDRLFVIRADSAHSLCLPKRIMKQEEVNAVRALLTKHMKVYH